MFRRGFLRKEFKPRLVPDPPKGFPDPIDPEELPETPAERFTRLDSEVREKNKSPKGKREQKGSRKGRDFKDERRKPGVKEAFSEDKHYGSNEDLESTDEERKCRGENDDDDEKSKYEHAIKEVENIDEAEQQQESPPVMSVEIQIEPPLDEIPIDILEDEDREGLLANQGAALEYDEGTSEDAKKKKDKNRKEEQSELTSEGRPDEDAISEVIDAEDVKNKEEADRGKEKRKRTIFGRRKKDVRESSTDKSGDHSEHDDNASDQKIKSEKGKQYLKRKETDRQVSDISPSDDGLHSPTLEDKMLDVHHKRRSSRWGSRGSSSEPSKRRLSSYTTSSGDTAIDFENSEDEVKENIRYHKNIIESVKTQPWSMAKKLRLLRTAKSYIKRHEGELAQSKQAKDIFATYSNWLRHSLHRLKREIADLIVTLTPWEMRIKRIESHFGSVVASYFIFLRWVFWLNSFISLFICCFLMVPEVLRGDDDITGMRKKVKDEEAKSALNLKEVWEFEGYLKYSPIFYGYYSDREITPEGYRLPLAYLLSSLVVYMFSFFVILRKMAENNRQSKMTEKEDECTFAWKLYTGWDYMIGNAETAHNKVSSLVMSFKESILEEKERGKEERSWKLITLRTFTNFLVLLLLGSSAYAVILVVARGEEPEAQKSWYRQNEVTLVLTGISNVYPNFFDMIGALEQYHPRQQLQWQLFRILMLYMLNLYTLIFALFGKVRKMTDELTDMKKNITFMIETGGFDPTPVTPLFNMTMNETSLDTASEFAAGSLEQFLFDAMTTFPQLDLAKCTTCNWLVVNCTLLLGLQLTFSFPTNMFFNEIPEQCKWTPYNTSWCGDQLWNASGSSWNLSDWDAINASYTPCPSMTTPVSATKVFATQKPLSEEQFVLLIANYTISSSWNVSYGVPMRALPAATSNDTEFTIWNLLHNSSEVTAFYDANMTYGNMTDRPLTMLQTPTVSISNIFQLDDLNCSTVYMPYCGKLPVPDVLLTDEQKTTPFYEREDTTTPRTPGVLRQEDLIRIDEASKNRLRKLCWETMFGQDIVKLTVMDLVMTIGTTVITDYIRAVFIRYLNNYWCWDIEVRWPGYGDFKIAENILHLVNNQGMVWMGMFFSPGLPAINTVKLAIMMYIRSWAVLTSNIPHETVFKASGNNFYYMLLLVMLFICTLPVGYAMVWLEPSWHCGPFSGFDKAYKVFTSYLKRTLPKWLNIVLEYCCSAGAIIPLILLLVLIIYYLLSITNSLRESNNDLMTQIRREKDEKRAKKEEEEGSKVPDIPLDSDPREVLDDPEQAEKVERVINMWSAASRRQSMVQRFKESASPLQRAVALAQEQLYREKEDLPGPLASSWNAMLQRHVDRARQMERKDERTGIGYQRSDEEPLVSSGNTPKLTYKQVQEMRALEQIKAFREKKRRQKVPKIMISKDGSEESQGSVEGEPAAEKTARQSDSLPLLLDPGKQVKSKKNKPTLRREPTKYAIDERASHTKGGRTPDFQGKVYNAEEALRRFQTK